MKLLLIVISGVCWTIVYIDGIRVGFRDKSYAIPFYALALNFAWELLYTYHGFRINGVDAQNIFNAAWLTFDIGILYTYFRFGRKYFRAFRDHPPANAGGTDKTGPPTTAGGSDFTFIGWSVLGLITAFAIQYAVIREFGVAKGAAYSAFPQNLIMSILFIAMLAKRGGREGQSLLIAVSKWIGTLAPTILFGVVGQGGFPRGSFLILTVGLLCSMFDVIYIWLLAKAKPAHVVH
ncbi:MAG: transmembrane-type terpene cyclase [Acidobacteriota bacterium]